MKMLARAAVALLGLWSAPVLADPVTLPQVKNAAGYSVPSSAVVCVDLAGLYVGCGGGAGGAVTQGTTPWNDNVSQIGGAAITLGQKTMANSVPVTLSSDGTYATAANQTSGNGTLTTISGQLPATLGQKTSAASLPVTLSSDGAYAKDSSLSTINTTLGAPFQAGGSIANVGFQSTGNVAAATADSGNPIKTGCYASGTAPTAVTNGQRANTWCGQAGQAFVALTNSTGSQSAAVLGAVGDGFTTQGGLAVWSQNAVYSGAAWYLQRGDANGTYAVQTPTASANNGLTTVTVAAATTDQLKASAGNVYSLNLVNSTAAGFVVLYDANAAPTSGTALTASLIRYCFPVGASSGFDKVFQIPAAMTSGAAMLFSTSCTTYTAVSPAPVMMTGQVK